MVLESEGVEAAAEEWSRGVDETAEEWGASGAGSARCLAVNENTRYGDVFLFRDGSLVCRVVGGGAVQAAAAERALCGLGV
jgi:hypothetical protein